MPADGPRRGRSVSALRRTYLVRLVLRCGIFAAGVVLLTADPQSEEILRGWNFFRGFSAFHVLWAVWVWDLLRQMLPGGWRLALGSRKLFRDRFRPGGGTRSALRGYLRRAGGRAAGVFALWAVLTAALAVLYRRGILSAAALLGVSLAFYVCDLICVLIWCPFRLFLGNRCCTTCRIFNWDHLMMFSPLLAVGGFFGSSLLILSAAAWLEWEAGILRYPERFWEGTNAALRCANCTDKLCTQYCGRDRRSPAVK